MVGSHLELGGGGRVEGVRKERREEGFFVYIGGGK